MIAMGVMIISESKHANSLLQEKSPYLLQHAYNPVDWYPWSEEAFAKAKEEEKPIFLSIGYSTCHWCHVMERESFEDEEVAGVLNRDFVAIKVDREERPDIDHIYMTVCQGMNGQGGWPLTIVMTPDKTPFFAATYLPKNQRHGLSGLMQLLPRLADLWQNERSAVLESGEQIRRWLQENEEVTEGELTWADADQAYQQFNRVFDKTYGGFGTAPKFPSPHNLCYLLRYYYFSGEVQALSMVEKTLESMYRGGIYDHIGFGFARYSTDGQWLVPHFEKMLYDNALLTIAYLEAYQITRRPEYARLAREVLTYVLRDMTAEEGGFYSAEDADSEGLEGKFYVWSPNEIKSILGEERGTQFCGDFDITEKGNFEGQSIPNLIKKALGEEERSQWEKEREKLLAYRNERIHPYKDDKILTAWNGLMIAALAIGYRVLGEVAYREAAEKALQFILTKLRRPDGRLLARYREGEASYPAYSADYSFLVWALTELYEATYQISYLDLAMELSRDQIKYFWDGQAGGMFFYGSDAEQLLTRPKEVYDGALPSDNSVALLNFLRLSRLTGDPELEEKAQAMITAFADTVSSGPTAHSFFLSAVLFYLQPSREAVIVGSAQDDQLRQMRDYLQKTFLPDTVVLYKEGSDEELHRLAPFTEAMKVQEGGAAAYVCEGFACQQPVTDVDSLRMIMHKDVKEKTR
jgi:uncharacterized protein YyaL (SSP411 family)